MLPPLFTMQEPLDDPDFFNYEPEPVVAKIIDFILGSLIGCLIVENLIAFGILEYLYTQFKL